MLKKFEQHLQTIISSLAVAILLWVGVSVNALQQSASAGALDRQYLKEDVLELKNSVKSAYPLSRAHTDREVVKDIERRLRALEIRRHIVPTSGRVQPACVGTGCGRTVTI